MTRLDPDLIQKSEEMNLPNVKMMTQGTKKKRNSNINLYVDKAFFYELKFVCTKRSDSFLRDMFCSYIESKVRLTKY